MRNCQKIKDKKGHQGFTLVEVIIVLLIIGVMMAIALPNISKWIPNYRLKEAARDLYSNFQQVRILAVKENKNWAIVFDVTNDRYYLCSDSGADDDWSGTDDNIGTGDNAIFQTIDLVNYKNGIKFGHGNATQSATSPPGAFPADNVSYASDVVIFNPNGTGTAGYVYLDHEDNTTTYVVGTLTSGSIQLKKWKSIIWE